MLVQGSILAIAGIITRIIGLAKRVPLTEIISDVGNSYYSVAYELYTMILMISSYSMPLAVSKVVAQRVANGEYRNARRVFKASLIFAFLIGSLCFILVFIFAEQISAWSSEPMSYLALQMLAPTLLIVAVMGVFRGYFQGLGTMVPTALSQIFEQIFVVAVSLIGAYFMMSYGEKIGAVLGDENYAYAYGAGGAAIGPGVGALVGLAFLIFVYMINKKGMDRKVRRDLTYKDESYMQIFRIVLLTIFPVVLSTAIYNMTSIVDQKMYHQIMTDMGLTATKSVNWGVYTGKYRVLINVPIAIANAMCSSITPAIAGLHAQRKKKEIREKIALAMRFVSIISIPSAVGLAFMARPIIDLLFNYEIEKAIVMMQFGSVAIVFYSISTLTNGVLQGIGKLSKPVIHSAISLALHCILLFVLLRFTNLNIYAVVISSMFFALLMCILNAYSIGRELHYRQEWIRTFVLPAIASIAMGSFIFIFMKLFYESLGNLLTVLLALPLAIMIYFVILILLGGLNADEVRAMPYGKKLYKLFHVLRLM